MGVPAKVVHEILGHDHINITLGIYAHVLPGMHKEGIFDLRNEYMRR